ncbi:MAG: hypothetical protein LBI82_08450 [Dysgonamonadaceae bacterium]|jgi:uncharacterized protein (DUF1778 family)|nr:hypothetical protein [Dysgonamonadaceae bacterium]
MKATKLLIAIIALILMCGNANAQFGGLRKAVQSKIESKIEKAVEKKVEEKTDQVVNRAADQVLGETEEQTLDEEKTTRTLDMLDTMMESVQKTMETAMEESEIEMTEIPEVSNTPYTPSESEFAFFAMKKGAKQTMAIKDAKGKITSQICNTVKEITGSKNAFAIAYESEILDEKGNPVDKDNPTANYRVVIKDGTMYLDMKGMFGSIDGLDEMQVSGIAMKIPSSLAVGQTLEDANMKVKIGFMNCSVATTEGKCLAIEDVKVDAGTFRCYKVSQKSNASVMGMKTETTTLTWYAKGVGVVKSETYDKAGKLMSTQELIANR